MKIYIISAVRTPIGKMMGGLSKFQAPQLGSFVIGESMKRAGVKAEWVDEVIMGNVLQAGLGQNPARQAALKAELPVSVPAFTVNKVCGSGLKSVMLAAQAIKAGDANIIVAGGMESMSNTPFLLKGARIGFRLGHAELLDSMIHDGLLDAYEGYHMGITAELVADEYEVSRSEQDQFSVESHKKAEEARKNGAFKNEIIPVSIPQKKGEPLVISEDEGIRTDVTVEALSKLKPAFKNGGSVTAGNASQISDGASALVIAEEKFLEKKSLSPVAAIVAYATSGLAPQYVMMTPVKAVEMVLQKSGWERDSVGLFELNEAFASQGVAIIKTLKLDKQKVNVNGGAIALGHPIGASGARCLTTLLYAMKNRNVKKGIVSLCLGGGNGVAMAIELC